jgi:hypothetical protein
MAFLSLEGLIQFLQLWDTLLVVEWSMDRDQYLWKHEASGSYSKSAYRAIFYGSIIFTLEASGNLGPCLNAKCSFGLQLKINVGLQTD